MEMYLLWVEGKPYKKYYLPTRAVKERNRQEAVGNQCFIEDVIE